MASISYPRPGHNSGFVSSEEHERLVQASQSEGLFGQPSNPAPVFADGTGTRLVKIRAGQIAHVRGSVYESGATDIALPSLAPNTSGSRRIDLVVLRLDRSDYSVRETVITGMPAATPVAPTPLAQTGTTGYFDLPLAEVRVDNGVTALAADTVTTRAWYLTADGEILCTISTSPPHDRGRRKWETDTARLLVSNGTAWRVVSDDASGAIVASSGISHSGVVLHRRNGMAAFALTAWRPNGPLNANTEYSLGNIPDGFRPKSRQSSIGICPSTQSVLTYSVGTDGAIVTNPGATAVPTNRACVLAAMSWPLA